MDPSNSIKERFTCAVGEALTGLRIIASGTCIWGILEYLAEGDVGGALLILPGLFFLVYGTDNRCVKKDNHTPQPPDEHAQSSTSVKRPEPL